MTKTSRHIMLTLRVHQEGEHYVSQCAELGVASFGDTLDEAFHAVKDAVAVYLETLADEGELERVFAERGIEVGAGAAPENGRVTVAGDALHR